ncbi:unnamed protein product, partial [Discosporangium mesarthrocarpum]
MRSMYHSCHLVHGDLSEYNLLYLDGKLIFIDVSQSMEHEHPRAMDFLRMDCRNVTSFFRKRRGNSASILFLSPMALFNFILDDDVPEQGQEERLQVRVVVGVREACSSTAKRRADKEVEEAVFMNSFIPRNLHQV